MNCSAWIGTRDEFTVTAKVDTTQADGRHGTVRINKAYIVHLEQIKQGLRTGEAFWATKVEEGCGVRLSYSNVIVLLGGNISSSLIQEC